MLGADTALSAVVRIVSTVAILAAVYFLIVKPILNTTESAVHDAAKQSRRQEAASRRAQASGERQRALSYARSALAGSQPWFAASREIRRCALHAGRALGPLRRCSAEGSAIVTRTLSARNFSISYADSLTSQGKDADARRVRDCVAEAGFRPLPMYRCRRLADRLLFG